MQKNYKRLGFSPAQKHELWERWRRGNFCKIRELILGLSGFDLIERPRLPVIVSFKLR